MHSLLLYVQSLPHWPLYHVLFLLTLKEEAPRETIDLIVVLDCQTQPVLFLLTNHTLVKVYSFSFEVVSNKSDILFVGFLADNIAN